jgi:hypothetical protein
MSGCLFLPLQSETKWAIEFNIATNKNGQSHLFIENLIHLMDLDIELRAII